MTTSITEKPKPKNEIRIGLVLYGGVSLAIYIYGVVLEFLRAVRAWEHEDWEHDKNPYHDILKETDSKIVVDIISGTSAGGINGVLLAKALASGLNSQSFGMLRSVWLEAGDFSSLLKPGRPEMASLLDEGVLERSLLNAFNQMDDHADLSKPSVLALDLYVSSTDLHGRVVSGEELGVTAFNKPIESKEYRRMFQLKFRKKAYIESDKELGADRNDFTKGWNETLLKVCRATSAFPAALRPVKLEMSEESDKRLMKPDDNPTIFLTDGGVLNNKPFSDTISAIFRRDPLGKVERLLFYVEPDPETYIKKETNNEEPGFWEVVSKSAVGIPSYQSITNDIRNIKDRNRRIAEFRTILNGAEQVINSARQPITKLADRQYRNFLEDQVLFKGYQELKISQLNSRLQDLFLEYGLGFENPRADACTPVRTAFKDAFDRLSNEARKQDRLKDVLGAFDAPYRYRRLFRLTEVTELLYDSEGLSEPNRRQIDNFMVRISELLEKNRTIEWRTWNNGKGQPRGWFEESLDKLSQEVSQKYPNYDLLTDNIYALLKSMMSYSGQDCRGLEEEFDELKEMGRSLAADIDKFKTTLTIPKNHPLVDFPPFESIYTQFEFRDMFLHPIEVIGNLGERDPIDIVRISPKDATHISSDAAKKLAGDTLFHFGGFMKKEWRNNDIMWGRLDAAELIVRTLCRMSSAKIDENAAIDKVLTNILAEDNDESRKAVEPGIGYKRYMVEKYNIGAESLKDVDTATRFRLILDTILSVRDMMRYDLKERGTNKVTAFIDKWLAKALNVISVPLNLLVKAFFDRDSLIQTVFSFIILSAWVWGLITIILFIVEKALSLAWLKIDISLAGIALGTLILATLLGFLIGKRRVTKKQGKKR